MLHQMGGIQGGKELMAEATLHLNEGDSLNVFFHQGGRSVEVFIGQDRKAAINIGINYVMYALTH